MTTHQVNQKIKHLSFFILSAFLYFGFSATEAKELWVDILSLGGTCSDARTREDVSPEAPWCNLGPAGEQATAGDLVTVRRGAYTQLHTCSECYDTFVFEVVNSGTSTAWIQFRAMPGEQVVISGDGGVSHGIGVLQNRNFGDKPRFISIEGFEVRDFGPKGFCTWVRSTSDVVLRDLNVHGCTLGAVELHDTARVTVEDSLIHDNPMSGWTSAVDLYRCREDHVIRRNLIWGNTDTHEDESEGHGIIMDTCRDYGGSAVIESNVIWENEGWCIATVWADNSNVRNNTCYMNGNGRENTGEISIGNEYHRIYNNIAVPREGRLGINIKYNENNTIEHNLVQGDHSLLTWPTGLVYINADPLFVDPAAWDFRLMADSPAIDTGDNSNAAPLDADGVSRPQDGSDIGYAIVDIGAYEYVPDGVVIDEPIDDGTSDDVTGGDNTQEDTTEEAIYVIVDFDNPTPLGDSFDLLSGVFEGIDFGEGQWRWESAWKAASTNHVFFDSESGLSRDFRFADSPAVLTGMMVTAGISGTLTLTDDAGQSYTTFVTAGQLKMIETGWTQAAQRVTVSYSAGWSLAVDDITYVTE